MSRKDENESCAVWQEPDHQTVQLNNSSGPVPDTDGLPVDKPFVTVKDTESNIPS
jgi:hypothetical protein